MRIPDADPGDQNHADSCGCGSATLIRTTEKEKKLVLHQGKIYLSSMQVVSIEAPGITES
jgi:hypothetical protein